MATTAELPKTIDEVIARMEKIDAELDPADGLAPFNHIYVEFTKVMKENVAAGAFQDNAFVERMDIIFAGMYLRNVEAAKSGRSVDAAWAPLFHARDSRIIWPAQFVLAGMNAHINHDLAVTVVQTCAERRTTPDTPPVHQDYEKVNDLLAATEAEVRARFELQLVKVATRDAEILKHNLSSFSIAAAREAAWTMAQSLWRDKKDIDPLAYSSHEAFLAAAVGGVSRTMLVEVVPPPAE